MTDIFEFLDGIGVAYERHDHPPVNTVEEALRHVPELPGAKVKNLFLSNRRGTRYVLVVVGFEKRVDLKELKRLLGIGPLRFGSHARLKEFLGLEPGAVSILGLANDRKNAVELIVDDCIWQEESFQCHPLVNTSTVLISKSGMERFLRAAGHEARVVHVPGLVDKGIGG